jgi:heme/copper-type cytochrome/quinol oxidase subunit 2
MCRVIALRVALTMVPAVLSQGTAAAQPVHEVAVIASKPGFGPSTIEVTAGEPVRLVIRSNDVVHGFSIPKLKIDVHIPKSGETVFVSFIAPPPGQYRIECSEYCGNGHGQMKAVLTSRSPL